MGQLALNEAPELSAIEASKADQIRQTFEPMVELLNSFDERFNNVIQSSEEKIDVDLIADAKRLRLDIAKVRIETDKLRKEKKEAYLRAGKAIDGVSNILKWAVSEKEDKLKAIENHFEEQERLRREALQKERVDKLIPYVSNAEEINLADMESDVFDAYFSTKKKEHEDRLEAERLAEEERQRKLEEERAENERIRLENERLKKEREEREAQEKIEREKREKEQKEREQKEREEREEREKKLREEREAREEAERKLKEEEEKRKRDEEARLAEEKRLKAIATAKADKPKREMVSTEILQLRQRLIEREIEFKSEKTQEMYLKFINESLIKASEMFKV